jgi:lipopolysaccharide biosynthesis regulator YciM
VIAAAGEQWVVVIIILVFLFGLFLGARLPIPRGKRRGGPDPRQSPGYIRGMYAMLTGDVETAIENLSKVVELSSDPIEVYLALGNLYRQRGQIDRAIRVHQSLLTRASLSEEDRVLALNALGMDFRTGGLMDRSMKTFRESLALSPKDPDALAHLVKLSEDLGEWDDAYDYAVRLHKLRRHRDPSTQSYLLAQKAQRLAEGGMHLRAAWDLHRAIRLYPENMMAYIFLARLRLKAGKPEKARRILQKALRAIPHKSFMVLGLLKEVSLQTQDAAGYMQTLRSLAEEHHQKRAMLQLLQEYLDLKRRDQVMPLVRELVKHFGRSRLVQRTLWDLLRRGLLTPEEQEELTATLAGSDQMMDHFNCIYCGYKTLEILHRCPNCKQWNSFADGE